MAQFNLPQKENLRYEWYSLNGILIEEVDLGSIQQTTLYPILPVSMTEGLYILKIRGNQTDYTTKVFVKP